MWINSLLMAVIGLSAGFTVAAGLGAVMIELGVISDFADRTHTGEHVLLYEDSAALGGILGNLFYIYQIAVPGEKAFLAFVGLFAGIFAGCWAMALAEILNVFPIAIRRMKLTRCIPYIILGLALGRGIGAWLFFVNRW